MSKRINGKQAGDLFQLERFKRKMREGNSLTWKDLCKQGLCPGVILYTIKTNQ